MQPTERFYEADAYRTAASSVITAVLPQADGGGLVALAGTVFYPEGGGQPADRGFLTLPDGTGLAVTGVHEKAGVIWHTVERLSPAAVPGAPVEAAIDWAWRFDKMQQHTGEHILSGTLHRLFGAENVGFHIGGEAVRMDTSVPISPAQLRQAETEANRLDDLPQQKGDRGPGADRRHPGGGRLRLLRHPRRLHRAGGADQDRLGRAL